METLTKIHLLGKLGAMFGKEWALDVKSPAEAIRAIDVNLKGALKSYLSGPGAQKYYKIALQKKTNVIDKEEIGNRTGQSDIFIIPTIRGSGGVAKIITGVVLVGLAILTQQYELLGPAWSAFAAGILGGLGASLILGGITQLLTPVPKNTQTDQKQSADFQGNASAAAQGGCVPVIYGKALASPIPVSISYSAYKLATTSFWGGGGGGGSTINMGGGSIVTNPLPGGGYTYTTVPLIPTAPYETPPWNPGGIFTNG